MFIKDTFRLIRSTFNRFFSLFMIVVVASGFMMGLFSIGQIMEESVDIYNDKNHFQDIQIYSSYGFCDEDIKELRKNEDVEAVFGSKFIDAYLDMATVTSGVYRIEELERKVNEFELISGRLPENDREALILNNLFDDQSKLLDRYIKVYLSDGSIKDYLKYDTYKVVGTCRSPAYLSNILGSSNCDNQDLDGVIFINNDNFISDYYSTLYINTTGSRKLVSYTPEYQDDQDKKIASLQFTAQNEEGYLREKIYKENKQKLDEARKEFEAEKNKGQAELDEAKKKLDDANVELIVNQSLIDSNKASLELSLSQINENEILLSDSEDKVNEGIAEAEKQAGMSFDTLYNEVGIAYTSYMMIKKNDLSNFTPNIQEELEKQLNENKKQIEEIDKQIESLDVTSVNYLNDLAALEFEKQNLSIRNTIIEESISNYDDSIEKESKEEMLKAIDEQFNGSVEKTYADLSLLYEAREKIKSGKQELAAGKAQAEAGKKAIEEAQLKLNQGKAEYEKGLKEYQDGLLEFNDEIEKAQNELNKAKEDLDSLPEASWVLLDRNSQYSNYLYENNVDQMKAIGFSLPFLFYLVAALVCMTTMTRLVDEQRSQIGIFHSLGFSEFRIIMKYVTYALLASLSGSIIGILIGQTIFPTVIYNTWRLMYDLPEMKFYYPLRYVLICLAAFALLMSFITALVMKSSLAEMPSELLRPKAPKISKKVMLEKITFLWKRLSFTSKITARNIFRYKSRFLMTIIGVAGCTGLLVVGFGIKDSISDIVSIQYGDIFNYDYQLNIENDHHLEENMKVLEANLDNKEIVPFESYTTKAYLNEKEDDTLSAIIVDARSSKNIFNLRDAYNHKEIELNNSGVIISEKFSINHHLKEGDYISIESKSGIKREVRIDHICEFYFQHYVFISDAYYESIFNEAVHENMIAIKTDNKASLLEDTNKLEDFNSLTDFSGFIEQFEIMIRALDFIILVIVIAAGSLALVVLLNLIQVNISERVREIATLKVLGFFDGEVNSYIFREIMLLSIIGGLIGLPLGIVEHHFIMNVINMEMMMFGMNISLLSFIYSFGITIIFTLLVFILMQRHINHIEMVESLKSVE